MISNHYTLVPEPEFAAFLRRINQAPILTLEEENHLTNEFHYQHNLEAAHRLVFSHLRLVVKTAREYLGYRLPFSDLIQEGSVGLMQAVKRFDPTRGVRLATYAVWWIRAAIHDYVLRSWRIVRIATTQLKRHLFFKLRQARSSSCAVTQDEAAELAVKFGTDAATIMEMDHRMLLGDDSLNRETGDAGDEIIERLQDRRPNQESRMLATERSTILGELLEQGMARLDQREQLILTERFMGEHPKTLDALSQTLQVSRERVRQLEKRALRKLKEHIEASNAALEVLD